MRPRPLSKSYDETRQGVASHDAQEVTFALHQCLGWNRKLTVSVRLNQDQCDAVPIIQDLVIMRFLNTFIVRSMVEGVFASVGYYF